MSDKQSHNSGKLNFVKLGAKTLKEDHGLLLRWAFKLLKYLLLFVFSFALACILSASFGTFHTIEVLMSFLGQWFWRLAVFMFCFMAAAVLVESLR